MACNCSAAAFLLDQRWSLFSIFGRYRHAVQIFLCVYSLVSGVGLYDLVNLIHVEVHGKGTASDSGLDVDTARILVSMIVNLMATLCIAVKAWYDFEIFVVFTFTSCRQFRGNLRLAFSKSATKKSLVNQVLTLLTEGGAIFCALQV